MGIGGLFDFLSIYDSITDNYGLCFDPEPSDYKLHSDLKGFTSKCSTGLFTLTGIMMVVCALAIYLTT